MKIEKLQKKGSRYKIVLDNGEEINTNAEVILNNNLLYDKDIDEKLLDKINSDTLYYDVYNKVINKIMTKWRSQYEVRKFLLDSGISLDDTNKIVKNLIDIGLINDKRFIKCFVNDKINLTMDGPNKMIRSLEDYKVDMDEVYRIIDQISEEEIDRRIDKLVMKKVCSNKKYSAYMLKQKIIQYLINLGYEKKDIERHLDKIKTTTFFHF